MPESIKVFVSYSWETETHTQIVDELEKFCPDYGITLIRDSNTLKHGDSIDKFMKELSRCDHVITLFSKPYFESKWCMYELHEVFKRGDFAERTHPVIADECNLQDRKYRLDCGNFWKKEHEQIKSDLQGIDPDDVIEERKESNLYRDISQNINQILNFAKRRNTTPLAELRKKSFAPLLESINPIKPDTPPKKPPSPPDHKYLHNFS